MKVKLRATVTITQEYDADSDNYLMSEKVPDMIEIDKRNYANDPYNFIAGMLEGNGVKTKITIVRVK